LRRAAVKDGRRPPFFTARSVLEGRSPQRQAGGKVRTSAVCYLYGMVITVPKAAVRNNTHG
jgi:hypothetical protein